MKIVIAGAGAVGFHLSELLSRESQDIILIDSDAEVLKSTAQHLDVLTITGDAASFKTLRDAGVKKAQLFIGVTTSEKSNILACMLAKQLGAKHTIARVSNSEHLEPKNKERLQQLGVDVMISPQYLASREIARLLRRASYTDLFEFEDGRISIVGFTADEHCGYIGSPVQGMMGDVAGGGKNIPFKSIALLRDHDTIIPDAATTLHEGDHLYFATQSKHLVKASERVGKKIKQIKRVMLVGGSDLAFKTAALLQQRYELKVVIGDEEVAKRFEAELPDALILCADPGDVHILKEEGLERMDAFVALTPNSEINIITSLMAKEAGVYKTIALVENVNYTHISQNIGIDTIINKKLVAANNIFRFVRKGNVEAIASLHGVDAEIIEFAIPTKHHLSHRPIADIGLPKDTIIAGVVRHGKGVIPDDDFYLECGDKVVVLSRPASIKQLEVIFE